MARATVYEHAVVLGCEGIVSKRKGSGYASGRSRNWIKTKLHWSRCCQSARRHPVLMNCQWLPAGPYETEERCGLQRSRCHVAMRLARSRPQVRLPEMSPA